MIEQDTRTGKIIHVHIQSNKDQKINKKNEKLEQLNRQFGPLNTSFIPLKLQLFHSAQIHKSNKGN